jgi:phospholipid-translocating ATPase
VLSKRNLRSLGGGVRCKGPNKLIYNFEGVFTFDNGAQEALELENTMWCNTVLCAGKILGLVVYTGKETRMEMNSKEARQKRGTFDNELNSLSKYLFGVMLGLSISLFVLSERQSNPVIGVFKYILLLSAIIPISLRVNLDFSKIVFSYKISTDNHIEGAVARNSGIPEELGRVEFILSDKTGTLT